MGHRPSVASPTTKPQTCCGSSWAAVAAVADQVAAVAEATVGRAAATVARAAMVGRVARVGRVAMVDRVPLREARVAVLRGRRRVPRPKPT